MVAVMNDFPPTKHFHVMDERETMFWYHQNPELRHWARCRLLDRVGDTAYHSGLTEYVVYDMHERFCAHGVCGYEVD